VGIEKSLDMETKGVHLEHGTEQRQRPSEPDVRLVGPLPPALQNAVWGLLSIAVFVVITLVVIDATRLERLHDIVATAGPWACAGREKSSSWRSARRIKQSTRELFGLLPAF
jgi:hypothetical protein